MSKWTTIIIALLLATLSIYGQEIAISTVAGLQFAPAVATDGTDFFAMWEDARAGTGNPKSQIWTEGGGGTSPEIGVPENLAAVIEGENVRITWDPVEGAESYQFVHTEFPLLFLGLYDAQTRNSSMRIHLAERIIILFARKSATATGLTRSGFRARSSESLRGRRRICR